MTTQILFFSKSTKIFQIFKSPVPKQQHHHHQHHHHQQLKNSSLTDLSNNNNNNNNNNTTQTSASIDTSSNLNELIKMLQEQLSAHKQSHEEDLRQLGGLREALAQAIKEKDKCVSEREAELTKEKDLNKLLIRDLEEVRQRCEKAEGRVKQLEAKATKHAMNKEEKMRAAHQTEVATLRCKLETARKESVDKCTVLEARYKVIFIFYYIIE
jgi:DNA repair exonuclease SbcCD ATPase subunit